jgi:hypothetical protein
MTLASAGFHPPVKRCFYRGKTFFGRGRNLGARQLCGDIKKSCHATPEGPQPPGQKEHKISSYAAR